MAEQQLPPPVRRSDGGRTSRPGLRASDRATSIKLAERLFDRLMMGCFAVLGLLLLVLAVLLHSVVSAVGAVVVLAGIVPLWLGGRTRDGRPGRTLGWYPVALVLLVVGLVLWVDPWR